MIESKWGLRFIALVLALLFFLSVNNVFGNIFDIDNIGQKSNETVEDVPVQVKYDYKTLYASNVPESVGVELSGSHSQILKNANNENIKAVLDLTGEEKGIHSSKFKVSGLEDDIKYSVKPKQATVNLEEKVSKNIKVTPDVSSKHIDDRYKISDQSVSPENVKVTGGQEQIDKIAYLKATYKNDSKITQDTTDVAKITAFDKNLNKLNVAVEPKEVNLSVKLEPYSKKVKLKTKTVGSLSDGNKLDDIKLSDKEVEIFGNRDDLEDIDSITAKIDLDDIHESTEQDVDLELPDNVSKAEPNETTATINLK